MSHTSNTYQASSLFKLRSLLERWSSYKNIHKEPFSRRHSNHENNRFWRCFNNEYIRRYDQASSSDQHQES